MRPSPPPAQQREHARLSPLERTGVWLWRLLPPLLIIGTYVANKLAHHQLVHLLETHLHGCIFRKMTGIACPGCGGTRAFKALLEGNLAEAFLHNLFWIPTLLILAEEYIMSWWLYFHPQQAHARTHQWRIRLLSAYAVMTCLWFILRNIWDL